MSKVIGMLYPAANPASPENWSGTPKGLADALTRAGYTLLSVPCRIPDWARIPIGLLARAGGARGTVAHHEPIYAGARSIAMASALRRLGAVDGLIAMGTDMFDLPRVLFDLPRVLRDLRVPVVTYDDGTYPLFLRYPDSELFRAGFPPATVAAWSARQAAACRAATMACVSTEWAKASVVTDFGVPAQRVRMVGMGHRLRRLPETRDFSSPKFLFVGVDWTRKNGQAVLDAFTKVRLRYPGATLDLVGEHPQIRQDGVTDHGYLRREDAAAQARLDGLFAAATAFVLPSLFDPSPIAYLEAASSGLPVIATTCGGAGELLGAAAISVEPRDADALTAAMLAVADPSRARAMGIVARRVAEGSTWDAVAGRIAAALFEDIQGAESVPVSVGLPG